MSPFIELIFVMSAVILCLVVYWLPTIIAVKREHDNKLPIIILNIFAGATIILWIAALVWACIKLRDK